MKGRCAYRGIVLDYSDDPALDARAVRLESDGLLVVCDGKVEARGAFDDLKRAYADVPTVNLSGQLLMPGFIDAHIHFPQMQMIAAYGEQLLEWLQMYTFPSELAYADPGYASKMAELFTRELLRHGTTTALVLGSVHPVSVESLAAAAERIDMRLILGKVLMDRHAPPELCDTPQRAYDESKALIERWHKRARLLYAVTPRFAATSSDEQLAVAGALLREFPDVYLHTHLAENRAEVAWVRSLFPERDSYTDVYAHHGLLTERSIFAHGVHLEEQELRLLSQAQCAIAFCPTSNLFLGSGLFPYGRVKSAGVRVAIATDVGAGTSFSLLSTLNEAYKTLQLQQQRLPVHEALYLATLGSARALLVDKWVGSFEPGKEADFIVLNLDATPLLAMRMQCARDFDEQLFALVMLGDDRAVSAVYLRGLLQYTRT